MPLPKQDQGSLTHTRPFLGVFLGLHVPSPPSRQGLKGMSAEKSVADLVRHTKVSPVSPLATARTPAPALPLALSPHGQRTDPWLQSLDKCRCPLLFGAACEILGARSEACRAQLCVIHIPGLFIPVLPLQVPIQASLLQYSDSELNELATKNFQSKDLPGTQHCRGGVGWSGWAHTDTVGLSGSGNRVRRVPPKAFLQFITPCVLAESFPQKGRCLGCKVSQNTLPGLWADSTCPVQAL